MRKVSITLGLLAAVFFFQFCSSSKKAAKPVAMTYEKNIMPIIQANCAPCHIAGKGDKISLDNYTQASTVADNIIERVQKNTGERGFMPAMHPKLSDSTINLFVQWKNSGLPEK